MASRIDAKNLFVGLLIGLILPFALGAGSGGGKYRLSMAASDDWAVYGEVNTVTGEVETWTYRLHSDEIPRRPKKLD